MKTRNWTIETLDFIKGTGILDLNLGKGKIMELQFEVEFERDGDEIEQVDVKLTPYTIHNEDGILKHGILNKRNTNLICEMLEEIIISDPCSYGFEMMQDDFDYYQELTFEERRLSNM
jgi:hypothetical protein